MLTLDNGVCLVSRPTRLALSLGLGLALAACATSHGASTQSGEADEAMAIVIENAEAEDRPNTALEARYILGLTQFDRGDYRLAAQTFAGTLLEAPKDPSGDNLRHLLIQHIGWSLLGVYDVSADPMALEQGEAVLERYLVKHEDLRPEATRQRDEIYELLGEYSLRRNNQAPPNAHARLRALVVTTQQQLARGVELENATSEDAMVRTIVVDTTPWAELDDPKVQRYFRDPRDTGAAVFEGPARVLHLTRVLVRGTIPAAEVDKAQRRQVHALLASARPTLERCYETAIAHGADTLEHMEVSIRWGDAGLASATVGGSHSFDDESSRCVVAAFERGGASEASIESFEARLDLTFFVQPPRYAPLLIGPLGGDGGRAPGAEREDIAAPIPPV